MPARIVDRFFANPASLPSMPEIAHRLLKACDREDVDLGTLSHLVGQDQGLSVKLLRLANSARFSPRHEIATLQDAAATVGMTQLRDMSLAACVAGAFPAVTGFDRLRFWRQCMACAGHARTLAQACDVDEDRAYLAGLVLRTGELLMLMVDPEHTLQAEADAHLPDSLMDHEKRLMDVTHADVSAELAKRWRFPETLTSALAAAADPMAVRPFSRLGAVLRLAQVLSEAGDRGVDPMVLMLETQRPLVDHLHLDLDWLAAHLTSWDQLTAGVDQLLH